MQLVIYKCVYKYVYTLFFGKLTRYFFGKGSIFFCIKKISLLFSKMEELCDLLDKSPCIFDVDEREHLYKTFNLLKDCQKKKSLPDIVLFSRIASSFQLYLKEIDWNVEARNGSTDGLATKSYMEFYLKEQNLNNKFYYALKVHELIDKIIN
tara:strand:- start:103 stop:558 length:456 start_codon:yes stop_codon:yes gene_type:complete